MNTYITELTPGIFKYNKVSTHYMRIILSIKNFC